MGFFKTLLGKVQQAPPAPSQDVAASADQGPPPPCADGADAGLAGCCARLLPGCSPDMPFQISCYGARLAANKAGLARACADCGLSPDLHALLTAMAMIETNNMCCTERDATKDDNTDGSANVSLFNLSVDLVKSTKYQGDAAELNGNVEAAVGVLATAITKWGVMPTLDFVRGGRTGFEDHVSYGCADYRRTVATVLQQIAADPALLTDDRRVEVDLVHV